MCSKFSALALLCAASCVLGAEVKDKRQVGSVTLQKDDHQVAETHGFGAPAAVHAGSKYFQDMYTAQHSPHEIEFGHVCESPQEWEQRFEKINFEDLSHQGKVRWGDKHGGYGEHYWDYNHAGHHDGGGEESQQKEEYVAYDESQQSPTYVAGGRGKRQPNGDGDVEFINENARALVLSGVTGKHGGNYKRERDYERGKREGKKLDGRDLVYDQKMGLIVDQKTGIAYELKPVVEY
ncbi:uncharacterized protein LOC123003899 isoform X1 [Tribolium madens]|uniref:uncharacterized protein LOC123003899 isoform X1 n=1 Tax=Tribolium madens TaxID=41895 RepID=UPI001CF7572A|nr:uncharacterized protein LOC123003899 isoform X1 [Tribolium madens]